MDNEWKKVDGLADFLERRFGEAPEICIVLGSGLGAVTDGLGDAERVATKDIDLWPASTVAGHAGAVHVGMLGAVRTLILQGRVHLYEGYTPGEVTRPVRAAVTWGVKTVILTNAAGGISEPLTPGRLMLIDDHINLTGHNPLVGAPADDRGPRFPDLTDLYSKTLRARATECAAKLKLEIASGTYVGMLGPTYETPAEIRFLRGVGADGVGMSTVLEAIAACHLGAQVAGISCITNRAAGLKGAILDHDHVQLAAETANRDMTRLLTTLVTAVGEES